MEINVIRQRRTAQIWRAGGMIWLILITCFFAFLDLYFADLSPFSTMMTGAFIAMITIILFYRSLKNLNHAKKLPDEKTEEGSQKGKHMLKWFLIILAIEIVALNITSVVLWKSDHFQYIVPVDILIVSLHFIPLGRIFTMPVYYLLGIIISFIVLLTIIFIPASSRIGNLIAVAAIPSLSFILLNWMVIIYILRDRMKYQVKISAGK